MNTKLTICIPIYNCAEFVGQALDSILSQTTEDVEVVVYDGGSTDSTQALMATYVNVWPNLHYYRGAERGGIDVDMVKCVGYARSEYCWLFSGDDVMRGGAIAKALNIIKSGIDVYICKHTICNKAMIISHEHPVLQPDQKFSANLAIKNERMEWFQRAVTTEAFFSFMSGLIVRREKWQKGNLPELFNGSCWGHVARFFELIPNDLTVCYVAEVWLDQRGENDSFSDKGVVNRYRIGIEGYHKLADNYFGHNSIEAFNIRRVIRNEFPFLVLLLVKILCAKYPQKEDRKLFDRIVYMEYCDSLPSILLKRTIYFCTPYWLIIFAKFMYQPIKKIRLALKK